MDITSELQLLSPQIAKFQFTTSVDEGDKSNNTSLGSLPIEVDYDVMEHDDKIFVIGLSIEVNRDWQKKSGYQISLITYSGFDISQLSDSDDREYSIAGMLNYQAVVHAINDARSYLKLATQDGYFGSYHLPMIDVSKLFNRISERAANQELSEQE